MSVSLKKWGNSTGLRIPSAIIEAGHFVLDQEMDIRLEEGKIIIEPIVEEEISLAQLVDGITSENMHSEIEFGPSKGQEVDL